MTVETFRRRARSARRRDPDAIAIGEEDANIFECPVCARPMGVGTRRCPGCGTRLLAGIEMPKVVSLVGSGLIAGLLVGVLVTVAAFTVPGILASAFTQPATGALASGAPGNGSGPTAAPVPNPEVPGAAISSLRQTAVLNQRLVADAERLAAAVKAKKASSVDIARALRAISASAAAGGRIVDGLADWSQGASLSARFAQFYTEVGRSTADGLDNSITSTRAYVSAGKATLAVVGGLAALDAEARELATVANVELPLVYPEPPTP